MKQANSPARQQGVALIVIMLIIAVMVSLAATMSERLFVNFKRAENRLSHQQAYWYSIGVEALAEYAIKESFNDGDTVNMSQPWALKEQVFPLDYGEAVGFIRDMQSCFNVNSLANLTQVQDTSTKPFLVNVFQLILEESQVDSYQAEVIADSVREFVDADSNTISASGVEDSHYESVSPAYMAPNGMLADVTELRAVNKVDQKVMNALAPVICAVPSDDWRLNVNTVDEKGAVILAALFAPNLSLSSATSLIKNRPFDGWGSVDDFLAESEIAALEEELKDKAKGYLATDSRFFELDAQVIVNESRVRIRSLLYSEDRKKVAVVRRRFGGISE
ncbi:type II secretion system minor pseudopilin GspK [Vibrio sp. SCSIO 43137]|uniref:type II secretion system minor pseudopilin GspK n=1 Tax=Vibrio sp. SCSIO 43137 TaxID=3021011 RepID=UPI002307A1C8|nr:type II secretion system minor pseudopilin GspK [Vibrio sp. SCSIO 43137]WCE29807.1 type II secretion system minor pseudopilin GspK [Vibrio sp. SCSIO 43137]